MGIEVVDLIPLPKDHEFLDEIQEVGYLQALNIVRFRSPIGKFWSRYGFVILAINNTNGSSWTEYFETVESAVEWLRSPRTDPLLLNHGDWVIYTNGGRKEVGLVKRVNEARPPECCPTSYFVWYHEGDTAACTPASTLQRIESPDPFTNVVNNAYAIESLKTRKETMDEV